MFRCLVVYMLSISLWVLGEIHFAYRSVLLSDQKLLVM